MADIDSIKTTTENEEQELFDAALGLVLNWTNRLLFLKLLESQLLAFNKGSISKFLSPTLIPDYDVLNDLFMKVLAVPVVNREEELRETFKDVPYLNSSLFEKSDLERKYFPVSGIRLGTMEVMEKTAIKDDKGKRLKGKLPTLEYLLRFLDAFDFGIEKHDDTNPLRQESKTIINASVLGKIFEKINGYKDGSFFTPGFITEYICRKTLRRAVVNRFNEVKGWVCADFLDLCDQIGTDRESRIEANHIINSLRICDPAVGSGHFLVSALNELIAIKREMGVLQDHRENPKRIGEYITVENDELVITNEDGESFIYDSRDPLSQRVQETLFEEKRTIIENCLFGVDLNPKSVEICQLRLWIELLKNAYYYKEDQTDDKVLQTLPNIDINIKQGNSLLSAYPVCIGRRLAVGAKDVRESIKNYKQLVREYKNCRRKDIKVRLNNAILGVKFKLSPPRQTELYIDNTQAIAEQGKYHTALEWMIEFPEVLDDNGVFEGFDVIIGNPPYISLEKF